jgi:hypothetical protein
MADRKRPTRWQKAQADWPGFQRRDLWIAVIGLGVSVGVLALLGFPGEAMIEVAIVAGSGALAAILYALGQLVWAWLQAPMRLLTDDMVAIRHQLESTHAATEKPISVRLLLLNSIRRGEQLMEVPHTRVGWEHWLIPVERLLTKRAEQADAELFLQQRSLEDQVFVLKQLVEKYN